MHWLRYKAIKAMPKGIDMHYNRKQYRRMIGNTMQYNRMQKNTIECTYFIAVSDNAKWNNLTKCMAIQCNKIQCYTMQYKGLQCSAIY